MVMKNKVYDNNKSELLELYGDALLTWNTIEYALAKLYLCSVGHFNNGSRYHHSALAGFYAISTFDGKLRATSASITQNLTGEIETLKSWTQLCNRILRLKKKRNKLAHYTLAGYGEKYWLQVDIANPVVFDDYVRKNKSSTKFYSKDISELSAQYRKLQNEINTFNRKLLVLGEPDSIAKAYNIK